MDETQSDMCGWGNFVNIIEYGTVAALYNQNSYGIKPHFPFFRPNSTLDVFVFTLLETNNNCMY